MKAPCAIPARFTSRCPIAGLQECCSVKELTEWAQREKLGARFQSGLEEVVKQGGLRRVNDAFLLALGIQLPPMRKKILGAIKRKLIGSRTVRFGEVVQYEPMLKNKPRFSKCPWVDLDEIEVRNDKMTLKAAITTWRFCATGLDGQEETALKENAFNAWKPKPKAGNCVLGRILWIHLLIHGILHDFSSPASRGMFDAASIHRSWPYMQAIQVCDEMLRVPYRCSHEFSWSFNNASSFMHPMTQ